MEPNVIFLSFPDEASDKEIEQACASACETLMESFDSGWREIVDDPS